MKNIWRWIIGIVVGLALIGFLWAGSSSRQAYRAARGAIEQRVEFTQDRIDAAAEMAMTSVDLALELAGELPSQQAKADLVKQDIEEISDRLKEAADLRGQAAIDRLDQSIEQFNQTLQTVEDTSNEADSPAVKATLDRIYGVLLATQEQITEFLLTAGQ
jgi:biopolymer transport protein ExbB/TolQ